MKTPMLFVLPSFTQILLVLILPLASADVVDETCKNTPYTDFCITTLRSHPRSSVADTRTLGLIMVDEVDANAKSTLTKIEDLLRKAPDPRTKQALSSCDQPYKIIVTWIVPPSKESLMKGDYKLVINYMNVAAKIAFECEMGFRGSKSPIRDSNDYERKAATVASAIANLLL